MLLDRLESRVLFSNGFVFSSLASFGTVSPAPEQPSGSLVQDSKGDIFGTTQSGGANGNGTVFEIAAATPGTITTLVSFNAATTGETPLAGLAMDSNGNLYGTTSAGGANGTGTVFEIPASSLHSLLILGSFAAGSNVATTFTAGGSGVVVDSSGNVYGITASGGANGTGSVWELAAGSSNVNNVGGSGSPTTIASFAALPGMAPFTNGTGANPDPYQALVLSGGTLYGTTDAGGVHGDGNIFSLSTTPASPIVDMADFASALGPFEGSLVMDGRGDIFGASTAGGSSSDGTIFELENEAIAITNVLSFSGADGQTPTGPLIMDANGDIFGTTLAGGGAGKDGTAYEVADGSGTVTTLEAFANPTGLSSGLVEDGNGDLFGATNGGGNNGTGSVFELIPGHLVISGVPTLFSAAPQTITPQVTLEGPTGTILTTGNFTDTLTIDQGGTINFGTQSAAVVSTSSSAGVANFTDASITPADAGYTLTATDSNGDTLADSVTFTVAPQPLGASTQLAFSTQPIANTGTLGSVVVNIEDSSGALVTGDDSLVTITKASGPGNLSGTLTVQAVNGQATFTGLNLTETGTYTLTATDDSLTAATSKSFSVEGTLAHLVLAGVPSLFGESPATISPTVTLENSDGQTITGEDTPVTLAINNGGHLNFTTVTSVNGVATFTGLAITPPGSLYMLTATDGNGDPSVSSADFTVAPAPAETSTKLAFLTQPTNNTGAIPAVAVAIENSSGAIVTTDDSLVTISKATSPGTLAGTLTVQADNGVAVFSGLSLNTVDTFHLIASDSSLTSATSSGFNVTAVPTSLSITSGPSSPLTAGVLSQTPVVVQVLDQFGNPISSGGASVAFSVVDGSVVASGTAKEVNGTATFSKLKVDTAGTFTLIASSKGVLSASKTITVTAAAAASMVFVSSVPQTTAGAPFGVTVELLDKFGNVATGDTSSVTLSLFGHSPAALDGTLTATVTDGMATYNNLSITAPGTYQIVATDAALKKSIKTAKFTVA